MQARAPPHPVLPRKRLSAHNNILLQTLRERYPLTASLTGTQHFHVLGSGQHALPPAPYLLSACCAAHCLQTWQGRIAAPHSNIAGPQRKAGSLSAAESTQGLAAADTISQIFTPATATCQHLTVPSLKGGEGW